MKRDLFVLIVSAAALAGCSAGVGLTTSASGHKFRDGVYTAKTDREAAKAAVTSSVTNYSDLAASTRNSTIYLAGGDGGLQQLSPNTIIDTTATAPVLINLNVSYDPYLWDPYDIRFGWSWNYGYWGWDPFYWDDWYWHRSFWSWGGWRPWPYWHSYSYWYGPFYDPCWYGPYRPYWSGYHYPYYGGGRYYVPAGNNMTASRGGRHSMGGAGINRNAAVSGRSGAGINSGSRPARQSTVASRDTRTTQSSGRTSGNLGTQGPRRVATASPSGKVQTSDGRLSVPASSSAPVRRTGSSGSYTNTVRGNQSSSVSTRANGNVRSYSTSAPSRTYGRSSTYSGTRTSAGSTTSYSRSSGGYSRSSGSYGGGGGHISSGGGGGFGGGGGSHISSGGSSGRR